MWVVLRGKSSAEKKGCIRLLLESAQETADLHTMLLIAVFIQLNKFLILVGLFSGAASLRGSETINSLSGIIIRLANSWRILAQIENYFFIICMCALIS